MRKKLLDAARSGAVAARVCEGACPSCQDSAVVAPYSQGIGKRGERLVLPAALRKVELLHKNAADAAEDGQSRFQEVDDVPLQPLVVVAAQAAAAAVPLPPAAAAAAAAPQVVAAGAVLMVVGVAVLDPASDLARVAEPAAAAAAQMAVQRERSDAPCQAAVVAPATLGLAEPVALPSLQPPPDAAHDRSRLLARPAAVHRGQTGARPLLLGTEAPGHSSAALYTIDGNLAAEGSGQASPTWPATGRWECLFVARVLYGVHSSDRCEVAVRNARIGRGSDRGGVAWLWRPALALGSTLAG